jgi:hypothetical protein
LTGFWASRIILLRLAIAGDERKMRLGLVLISLLALLLPAGAAERAIPDNQTEIDVAFWKSVENTKDRSELEAYLNRFPNGIFAELARLRLARMHPPSIAILPGPEPGPAPQPPVQRRPPVATTPPANQPAAAAAGTASASGACRPNAGDRGTAARSTRAAGAARRTGCSARSTRPLALRPVRPTRGLADSANGSAGPG